MVLAKLARASVRTRSTASSKAIDKAMAISKEKYAFAYEAAGDLALAQGNTTEAQNMWQKSKDMGNLNRSLIQKLQVPK